MVKKKIYNDPPPPPPPLSCHIFCFNTKRDHIYHLAKIAFLTRTISWSLHKVQLPADLRLVHENCSTKFIREVGQKCHQSRLVGLAFCTKLYKKLAVSQMDVSHCFSRIDLKNGVAGKRLNFALLPPCSQKVLEILI